MDDKIHVKNVAHMGLQLHVDSNPPINEVTWKICHEDDPNQCQSLKATNFKGESNENFNVSTITVDGMVTIKQCCTYS